MLQSKIFEGGRLGVPTKILGRATLTEVQLLRLCMTFHTLPLLYLRTYILRVCVSKNYATVEIHRYFVLPYSRELTWRDVQHIIVRTASPVPVRIGSLWSQNKAKLFGNVCS